MLRDLGHIGLKGFIEAYLGLTDEILMMRARRKLRRRRRWEELEADGARENDIEALLGFRAWGFGV